MDLARRARISYLLRITVVRAAVVYGAYYLGWRVWAGTVDLHVWYLSVPLLLIETFAFYQLALAAGRVRPDEHLALTEEGLQAAYAACSLDQECRTVDVLVPTYDEPIGVLRQTIQAARDIEYPHETYVLDDGHRDWLRDCCMDEDVRYVTREDRSHFKAGNINHGLGVSDGDFVVVLDADFIALPNLIGALLPYFDDEKTAIVQAPQAFYNLDSFQHADKGRWNDQTGFFRTVLPAKAESNSAFWCGTPAMLRRTAIESVGGISTYSITEDIETSLLLQSQGWRIAYHNQTVAVGLAPSNIEGFMTQRLRWGRGALQLLSDRRFNPLTIRGLNLRQRLEYIESMTFWFQGWLFSLEYLVPPAVLISGVSPIAFSVAPSEFFARWALFAVAFVIANQMAAPRTYRLLETSMYRPLYSMIHIAVGLDALRGARPSFKVTNKTLNAKSLYAPFLVAMYTGVMVMAGSLAFRVARQSGIIAGAPQTSSVFWLAGAFALYFAVVFFLLGRRISTAATERRRYYRSPIDSGLVGLLASPRRTAEVTVNNLSVSGALIGGDPQNIAALIDSGEPITLELEFGEEPVRVGVELRDLSSSPGRMFAGVEFTDLQPHDARVLSENLLSQLVSGEQRYDDEPRVGRENSS
ncbi:MAG TPA: glycosyltransferase family 2 protein [Coriobacteriia bacterium]